MYTRDEYNIEILEIAHRVVLNAPTGQRVWPLLSPVEAAERATDERAPAGTLAGYDALIDTIRVALLDYVGESELPEQVERVWHGA